MASQNPPQTADLEKGLLAILWWAQDDLERRLRKEPLTTFQARMLLNKRNLDLFDASRAAQNVNDANVTQATAEGLRYDVGEEAAQSLLYLISLLKAHDITYNDFVDHLTKALKELKDIGTETHLVNPFSKEIEKVGTTKK